MSKRGNAVPAVAEGKRKPGPLERPGKQSAIPRLAVNVPPRLFGVDEAAAYLTCSRDSVRELRASGALRATVLPGVRRLLFTQEDLDALIESSRVQ